MKHYFLGMAAGYSSSDVWRHTFAIGHEEDQAKLTNYLAKRYEGEAILCKNGRSALTLALKAYFQPGDAVLVNGFTCYAVYEAVKAAELVPVFVDIEKEGLNFEEKALTNAWSANSRVRGIIVQNSLGNPVDIRMIERYAKKYSLTIIEDLAHCVGVKYADGREVGTVGAACALSFGKDKSIDTISGGAVVLRNSSKNEIVSPFLRPRISDHLRARFYPMFGIICRGLSYVGLGGVLMRLLVKIHWVEKSADNKLDTTRKISKFEAKLALGQLKGNRSSVPLREYYFVRDRGNVLKELRREGYYFDGFWYEKPVSPRRYYKKVHFPESECPNAMYVSEHIINLPTYYSKHELVNARNIIEQYIEEEHDAPKQ